MGSFVTKKCTERYKRIPTARIKQYIQISWMRLQINLISSYRDFFCDENYKRYIWYLLWSNLYIQKVLPILQNFNKFSFNFQTIHCHGNKMNLVSLFIVTYSRKKNTRNIFCVNFQISQNLKTLMFERYCLKKA